MNHYYLQLTDCPSLGMLYWDNGQYLFPTLCHTIPEQVNRACEKYLIRVNSLYNVTAETDGGCDRVRECVDYWELKPENVIIKNGELVGFYLDLGFYYSVSPERPNAYVFLISEIKPYHHCSGRVYTLITKESGEVYESSSHIY